MLLTAALLFGCVAVLCRGELHDVDSIRNAAKLWRPNTPEHSPENEDVRLQLRKEATSYIAHGQDFLDHFYYNPRADNYWALHGAKEMFSKASFTAGQHEYMHYKQKVADAYHYLLESIEHHFNDRSPAVVIDRLEAAEQMLERIPQTHKNYAHLAEHLDLHRHTLSLPDNAPDTVARAHIALQRAKESRGEQGIARAGSAFRFARTTIHGVPDESARKPKPIETVGEWFATLWLIIKQRWLR